MGVSSSKTDQNFDASQWERVQNQETDAEGNQITAVRNKLSGQLLDLYTLTFPNQQEFDKYIDSIRYRRNEKNIVRVVAYDPKVIKQFCGASYMLDVYLQHCRSRLSKYEDIPFPDYLYCGLAMLDGYSKLFNKIGRFNVTEEQVMIDENGEVRVWLNEDFSQNEAQFIPPLNFISNKHQEQFQMVDNIMRMVFENSDESQIPNNTLSDFYQRLSSKINGWVGFQSAKQIIKQYSRINNIEIPSMFQSVFEIYHNNSCQNNDDFLLVNQLDDHDENRNLDNTGQVSYRPVESLLNNQVSQIQSIQPVQYHIAAPGFARVPSNQNLAQVQVVNQGMQGAQTFPISSIHSQRAQPHMKGHHFVHSQNFIYQQPVNRQNQSSGLGIIRIPPPVQRPMTYIIPNRVLPMQTIPSQAIGAPFVHPHPQSQAFPNGQLPAYQSKAYFTKRDRIPFCGDIQNRGQNDGQDQVEVQIGADELEIQKKLILLDSGKVQQFVNEANIIEELSQFHKAEYDKKRTSFGEAQTEIDKHHLQKINSNSGHQQQTLTNQKTQPYPSPSPITQAHVPKLSQLSQYQRNNRQLYYTLENEVELDPEIAADIALFMKA